MRWLSQTEEGNWVGGLWKVGDSIKECLFRKVVLWGNRQGPWRRLPCKAGDKAIVWATTPSGNMPATYVIVNVLIATLKKWKEAGRINFNYLQISKSILLPPNIQNITIKHVIDIKQYILHLILVRSLWNQVYLFHLEHISVWTSHISSSP